jgi:hypothetical protein
VELLHPRCAGLDVAKDEVVACVRVPDGHGGRNQEVRTFQTFTSGLEVEAIRLEYGHSRAANGTDAPCGEDEDRPVSPIDAAVELARKVPELPAVEHVTRDRQRRDEVATWLMFLAQDAAAAAHAQFDEPCQRLTEASGSKIAVGVSSGGHNPRQLFQLQPALKVEGLDLDQGWPWSTGNFALIQFGAFGHEHGLPSLRIGVYPVAAESGLWLLPIPDLEVGPSNERLVIPEFLLAGVYAPVGPLPYLLEQTRVAAFNMVREAGNWFLGQMPKLLEAIVADRDVLDPSTWPA